MNGLGTILLPHAGEIDLRQLWLQPNGLPVERQGLPDINNLRQTRQRIQIDGEFETVPIPSLLKELLRLDRIITIEILGSLVPVGVHDPWPKRLVHLRIEARHTHKLRFATQNVGGDGLAI